MVQTLWPFTRKIGSNLKPLFCLHSCVSVLPKKRIYLYMSMIYFTSCFRVSGFSGKHFWQKFKKNVPEKFWKKNWTLVINIPHRFYQSCWWLLLAWRRTSDSHNKLLYSMDFKSFQIIKSIFFNKGISYVWIQFDNWQNIKKNV